MLSMKDIAIVKTTIEICNNPNMKKEVLCAPGSDYDLNKADDGDNKLRWYKIVENKATAILENLGLEKQLREKVISVVFSVGMRMLLWAKYHEGFLELSRTYIGNFLKSSFFTSQGTIDNKKAAKELMKDESLNIQQKYKLACLYCFIDHIPVLLRQMTTEDKINFYDAKSFRKIKQPAFVTFWSYYVMSEVEKLLERGESLDQRRFKSAVWSGSKTAVEYCLEKSKSKKMDAVVYAAVEAVRCRISVKPHTDSDWVFRNLYPADDEPWVPSDYYVDILCFLLSKMGKDQQIELFKKEIEVYETKWRVMWALLEGERIERRSEKGSIVLEYFLNWPYQRHFMKKAKLMWNFLPESYYALLLLMICDKIESKYDEGKSFDYRVLLKEFWCQSPGRYKRHAFKSQEAAFRTKTGVAVKTSASLLIKLLTLKNFTYEDEEIIKLILASATVEEKQNILSSSGWTTICVELMAEEKWDTLDRYTFYFFSSKEEESKFKREFSFKGKAQTVCMDFAINDNWIAAESFIRWSLLPDEEIKKLKEEMINSWNGLKSCAEILFREKEKAFDKFIRWFLPSEEVKTFKKKVIFSTYGTFRCAKFVKKDEQEFVNELIKFCLSTEEEVRELKKRVAYEYGCSTCKYLISDNENGGKWEEIEKFLTWCFSSEKEINDFKKNMLLKKYGEEIHFELINFNQWEEAETFFDWLGLSVEEIKELKKRTLLNYELESDMFRDLIYGKKFVHDERFSYYGNKQEAIELLLRWYLTDKEMVLECKDKLLTYIDEGMDEENEDLKKINVMIEQRLRDIDDENNRMKRTSETFPSNKRLCK